MYSQSSIFSRRGSRRAPTEEVLSGLACVVCGTDYRATEGADAVVVSHTDDRSMLACRGVCARIACGSTEGLDEPPLPLAERVRRYETGRAATESGPAPGDQAENDV
ncbi:hypothetical protein [Streptomyces sp. NPDC016845]|uniref:hypothetical protein n=1 Tax=Streptomyces sp. NPDC016845 TaxID=3364972 RepID=UPI0037895E73